MNTVSYEEWLDLEDTFDPACDHTPERDYAPLNLMARILGLSSRHLRRLIKSGVVQQRADGQFHRSDTLSRYLAHKTAQPLPVSVSMRDRTAELLQRRLDREADDLIGMPEALHTLDSITGSFLDSIAEVGRDAAKGHPKADRKHIATVIASATARLQGNFAEERKALRTGKREEEE